MRGGVPGPQQRVHPCVLIIGREQIAPLGEDRGLCRLAHRPAAPCRTGHGIGFGAAERTQRQRILRASRIGQWRHFVEIGRNARWVAAPASIGPIKRGFGKAAQLVLVGETAIAEDESGIVIEPESVRTGEQLPAADRLRQRALILRDEPCPRRIPGARARVRIAGMAGDRSGQTGQQGRAQQRFAKHCTDLHAGHYGTRLLITR